MDLGKISQIIGQWNKDKYGNPTLVDMYEELYVNPITKQVQLSGIPDEYSDIQIDKYNQVYDFDSIGVTDFKVISWNDRRVQFHSSQGGKLAKVRYKSRGVEYLSARSVFTCVNEKGEVIETLEDILERSTEEIKLINTLGDAVIIIRKLEQDVVNAQAISNELNGNIEVGTPLNNSLKTLVPQAQAIEPLLEVENVEANRIFPKLEAEVDSGNVLLPQLKNANTKAENLLPLIEPSYNKVAYVEASQLMLNQITHLYEYTLNHRWKSDKLCIEVYDMEGDRLVNMCKVVDVDNLIVRNDEKIKLKIVGNIGYWGGVN